MKRSIALISFAFHAAYYATFRQKNHARTPPPPALRVIALFLPIFGTLMVLRASVQGLGYSIIPTLNGIVESICRILWTMWLIPYGSFHQLCFIDPTSWTMAALMILLFYELKIKKTLQS